MASLYEQLMASKGAPKAAAASNSTQLRKAPVSLRSAMRKYAEGGDVTNAAPDYSRANDAFGGAGGVNDLRNQFLGMGLDENTIGSIFSKYYAPEPQQGMSPQAMTPPEPMRYSPEPTRPPPPEEPRYEPRYEEPPRPRNPDRDTPYIAPTTPQAPQTSYRQNADGTLTEIGYNGDPISGYTPEQTAMDRATRGLDPSEYTYVWNGQGYDKVRMGGITMDDGTFIPGATNSQGGTNIGTPDFFEQYANDPETMARLRQMYGFTGNQPEYQEPQIGYNPEPRYPEENVPPPPQEDPIPYERYYEPEIPQYPQYPTDPGFYQPPVYDNPAIEIAKSAARGGDIGKLLQDLTSRSGGQQSEGLAALIAKILASGGGGSLEKQRGLMELLGSIKGK